MISKACKYGIRAAIFVASRKASNTKLSVKEIAREVQLPEAFTAKIMQTLNKHRIITSLKGPYGGFYIEQHQLDQPVLNIVNAIDGMSVFRECGLGLKNCSETRPCPMHFKYKEVREALLHAFQETTVGQLAKDLNAGGSFLSNLNVDEGDWIL